MLLIIRVIIAILFTVAFFSFYLPTTHLTYQDIHQQLTVTIPLENIINNTTYSSENQDVDRELKNVMESSGDDDSQEVIKTEPIVGFDDLEIDKITNITITDVDMGQLLYNERDSNLKDYLQESVKSFKGHLLHSLKKKSTDIVAMIAKLSQQQKCIGKPIFLSMGRVSSPLYWQLIENFFYTMYTFHHLDCTVLICVSDPLCLQKCAERDFPCLNFTHPVKSTHIMEQVAEIKLLYMGNILENGVDLMLLDLDVGFLRDPMILYDGFLDSPEQVRCQMDIGWGMDRTQGFTWMTFPRANFGLFIVKSHKLTKMMFRRAWTQYQKIDTKKREQVATDQSAMQGAMSNIRTRFGLNFSYFYSGVMTSTSPRPVIYLPTLLLHKVERVNRHGIRFELGGEPAMEEIGTAIAVHATCYEKTTKLHALKATNAFWNTRDYYYPGRRTITKPIMLVSTVDDLLLEIQSLLYIAIKTKRALILPNILIGIGKDLPKGVSGAFTYYSSPSPYPDAFGTRSNAQGKIKKFTNHRADWLEKLKDLKSISMRHAAQMGNNLYWPAFRTISSALTEDLVTVLEPSFYHKIEKQLFLDVPDPYILRWDVSQHGSKSSLGKLVDEIDLLKDESHSRLVLDIFDSKSRVKAGRPNSIEKWARDSASSWGGPAVDPRGYIPTPMVNNEIASRTNDGKLFRKLKSDVKMCILFLNPTNGNRTCFNKCN